MTGVGQGFERLYGCRIVKIGDYDARAALARVGAVISHENDQWVAAIGPSYLFTPEVAGALGLLPNPEAAVFTFEDASGRLFTETLTPMRRTDLVRRDAGLGVATPLGPRSVLAKQWVTYIPARECVYLGLGGGFTAKDASAALDAIDRITKARPVRRYVVDLRYCSGSRGTAYRQLLLEAKRWVSLREASVVGLIGRETCSGGIATAVLLKERVGATLLGEPAGGRPSPIGVRTSFRLPHSGLEVFCSGDMVDVTLRTNGDALLPDIPVETTAAEYFAGEDPVLDAALSLAADPYRPIFRSTRSRTPAARRAASAASAGSS